MRQQTDSEAIIAATRCWISSVVIGLNLCPFARRVFNEEKIRYAVSDASDEASLLADLSRELRALAATPRNQIETTLLIHPYALLDFLDYNDFLGEVEQQVKRLRLRGVIQIANFHPEYRFADSDDPDAVENYTNRSPYPMLHLLREDSISDIEADEEELLAIPTRNIETMRQLGLAAVKEKLQATKEADDSSKGERGA